MGCDTKGVLLTNKKSVMDVCVAIENALNSLIRSERKIAFPTAKPWDKEANAQYKMVRWELSTGARLAIANFTFLGEQRSLHVFFDCDCDHTDLAPRSVSMSIGYWGHSELLVKLALHALSMFGPVHYLANDCESSGYVPLGEVPVTVMTALANGYLTAYQAEMLAERFEEASLFPEGVSFEAVFGVAQEAFNVSETDAGARWAALEALAQAHTQGEPRFLVDFHEERAAAES